MGRVSIPLSQSVAIPFSGCAGRRNTNGGKKTRKTFAANPRLSQQAVGRAQMIKNNFVVPRGQQVLAFLLATVPLCERMLLYNVVMAAWIMLPQRDVLERSLRILHSK